MTVGFVTFQTEIEIESFHLFQDFKKFLNFLF
jgi:hypothetical protein